jgi:N6-L-threonylcarbamoyladenine synthase
MSKKMRVLAIETSCDETAVAVLDCQGDEQSANFEILSHALLSQVELHRQYGGVFPAMAKREHAKNLVPLLRNALEEAEMLHADTQIVSDDVRTRLGELLSREADMAESFIEFISEVERPNIDAIAVTHGPGLEPALWVGVNFAQALALAWNVPLIPIDHMEGHFLVALAKRVGDKYLVIEEVQTPILGLLISGGHTELDLLDSFESLTYRRLGQTRDDAVGEAFDKVARMLQLPYPGGPGISRLAAKDREDESTNPFTFPRPMIDSLDFDFSFSGLKTAVLYTLKNNLELMAKTGGIPEDTREKEQIARAFEDAAADVLVSKTLKALEQTQALTLAVGGGVSANKHIQNRLQEALSEFPYIDLRFPPQGLTGDNGVMIGIAGFYRARMKQFAEPGTLIANGNLRLA